MTAAKRHGKTGQLHVSTAQQQPINVIAVSRRLSTGLRTPAWLEGKGRNAQSSTWFNSQLLLGLRVPCGSLAFVGVTFIGRRLWPRKNVYADGFIIRKTEGHLSILLLKQFCHRFG